MSTTWSDASDFAGLSEMTQKDRVRDILRSSGDKGACSYSFYALHLPNARNRIVELRETDGLDIETITCNLERYHAGERVPGHVRWIWWWNGNPRQRVLFRGI